MAPVAPGRLCRWQVGCCSAGAAWPHLQRACSMRRGLSSGRRGWVQVRLNFPNGDMVGHTGDLKATITACTAVDKAVTVRILAKGHSTEHAPSAAAKAWAMEAGSMLHDCAVMVLRG